MEGPKCKATVSLDISNMKDGDVAGFSAFNGHSGLLSVVKEGDAKRLVMSTNVVNFDNTPNKAIASVDIEEKEQVELNQNIIYLRIEGDFTPKRDIATFYYSLDNKEWKKIGTDFKIPAAANTNPICPLKLFFCFILFFLSFSLILQYFTINSFKIKQEIL